MAALHIYSESLQIWWLKNEKNFYHILLYTDGEFLITKWEISEVQGDQKVSVHLMIVL